MERININGADISYPMSIQKTLYASPYMVVDQKGYTKHYYNGGERFASRIGGGGLRLIDKPVNMLVYNRDMADVRSEYIPKPSDDLQTSPYIPLFEDGKPNYKTDEGSSVFIDHTNRIDQYLESVTHMLDRAMEHNPYSLEILYDLRIDRGKPTEVYYYHTDHLGSSSWITDDWGDAVQYLQYLPFGELWTDQRYTEWNTRYTFSGKEKDDETGYSYFGARYYDANLSIWLSVDPLASKYPHQSSYVYCSNNPIMLIDPTGMNDLPYLIFNGKTHTLQIWDDGNTPDDNSDDFFLGEFDAHNEVTLTSNGKWEDGTYEMQDKNMANKHPGSYEKDGITLKDSPNGAYGTDGIYRAKNFKETTTEKIRSGMGIHAGRENKDFGKRKTEGCIRTTPEAMIAIGEAIANYGPLQSITIQNNRPSSNSNIANALSPQSRPAQSIVFPVVSPFFSLRFANFVFPK